MNHKALPQNKKALGQPDSTHSTRARITTFLMSSNKDSTMGFMLAQDTQVNEVKIYYMNNSS